MRKGEKGKREDERRRRVGGEEGKGRGERGRLWFTSVCVHVVHFVHLNVQLMTTCIYS